MFQIAYNTYLELTRNRIFSMILFFAGILILFSLALSSLSLGQTDKIVVDFGLAMIEIFGLVAVVFIGSQLLFKEIEGKTIYLILSKPIERKDFILGKFFGFAYVLFGMVAIEGLVFIGVCFYAGTVLEGLIFMSLAFIYLKLLLLAAIILLFSTFTRPLVSIILAGCVYIIGHSITTVADMVMRGKEQSIALYTLTRGVMAAFPNFEGLNIKTAIGTPVALTAEYLSLNTLHAFLYLAVVLVLAVVIFHNKSFER